MPANLVGYITDKLAWVFGFSEGFSKRGEAVRLANGAVGVTELSGFRDFMASMQLGIFSFFDQIILKSRCFVFGITPMDVMTTYVLLA
jgi:hypothetical protein